jgi:hypothetical protein
VLFAVTRPFPVDGAIVKTNAKRGVHQMIQIVVKHVHLTHAHVQQVEWRLVSLYISVHKIVIHVSQKKRKLNFGKQ